MLPIVLSFVVNQHLLVHSEYEQFEELHREDRYHDAIVDAKYDHDSNECPAKSIHGTGRDNGA